MTSKNSLTNLFKIKTSQNIWVFVITFIAMFFTMPVIILMQTTGNEINANSHYIARMITENPTIYVFAVIIGVITPIVLFKYLTNKSEIDFYQSMPIKREKLFIINCVIGILMFISALLINIALSIGIVASSGHMSLINIPQVLSAFSQYSIIFMAFYSVTLFSVVITGTTLASIKVTAGLTIAPAAIFYFLFEIINLFYKSFYMNSSLIQDIVQMLTPFGNVFSISFDINDVAMRWYSIFFIALAFVCYKKRPSENATNTIAIKIFKPILKLIVLLTVSLVGGYIFYTFNQSIAWFYIGSFLLTAVAHSLVEIIYELDFKALFKNFKSCAIYLVVFFAVITVIKLDLIGYDSNIPTVEKVSSVNISTEYSYYSDNNSVQNITNPDDIEDILKYAKLQIVNTEDQRRYQNFYVEYNLKNGKSFKRVYKALNESDEMIDAYTQIITSEEYLNGKVDIKNIADATISSPFIDTSIQTSIIEAVLENIKIDQQNLTAEYIKMNYPIAEFIVYGEYGERVQFDIYENFSNVINYLEQFDINLLKDLDIIKVEKDGKVIDISDDKVFIKLNYYKYNDQYMHPNATIVRVYADQEYEGYVKDSDLSK